MNPKNKTKIKFQVGNKVIIGFVLASVLVVGVSVVTYFSIRKLLSTVENLTEPNEKLRQLNGLMADVYLLDMSKTERTSDKDSVLEETERRIKERLDWLKTHAEDSVEIQSFDKISMDLSELLVVYAGLEEVRYNLTGRTFSEEALVNIERRIKRQQELSEMQFLGRIRNRDLLTEITLAERKEDSVVVYSENLDLDDNLVEIIKEFEEQESKTREGSESKKGESTDAALEALKTFMTKMYQDEQRLRQKFVFLESRLISKNKEVFYQIQQLISSMQREILAEYKAKNDSAYELTYLVSVILGVMIFLGVVGSLGFVNSILNEIRKGVEYRSRLEEAKRKSDDLAKAKQDFLANMSHEIRNPLHAIQGYQEVLKKITHDKKQLEYLKMMGFASNTLVNIVNDILDFSKLEAGKINIEKTAFNAHELFGSLKDFYALRADEKRLDFMWNINFPSNTWIKGDQLRISQIMNNLLSNAIKFTSNGFVQTSLTINTQNQLIIEVKDSGMGMSREVQNNIFQEFNQGDTSITRQFGGTGLGLAITKKLVDLLGGEISVESNIGEGTSFKVILPIETIEAPVQNSSQHQNVQLSLEGLRILLVDDDPIGIKLLKNLLESMGADIVDFQGGVQFVENFDFNTSIDLAILDIQMPQVSGMEVLRQLRLKERFKDLPVIAMTANVFVEEEKKLTDEGFNSLILKPFNEIQILEKLHELGLGKEVDHSDSRNQLKPNDDSTVYSLADVEKFCMGDEELLVEVMVDIITTTERDLLSLDEAIESKNYMKIREISHQLSSRMKQINVQSGDLAKEIELAIKEGNLDSMDIQVSTLIQELTKVLNILKQRFSN